MRNKHSMGRRFLALLLCALLMVGLMPTTALAATTTVSNATDLQNAIKNAKSGDTIKLGGNITFNDASKITTLPDVYRDRQTLTYDLTLTSTVKRRPTLAGIPTGSWEYLKNGEVSTEFNLPLRLREEDNRSSLKMRNGQVVDSYGTVTYVKEHGDATTYLLIKDKNLTIDLNGYTINATHNDAYFSALFVTGNSTVTIKGSGGITSGQTAITANGSGATVNIQGGSFTGYTAVAAIYQAKVNITGGTFTGRNMTQHVITAAVNFTENSEYIREDVAGDGFGYEQIQEELIYEGTASRTVNCATLFCEDYGVINVSGNPTVKAPSGGSLFYTPGITVGFISNYGTYISGGTFEGSMKEGSACATGGTFSENPQGVITGIRNTPSADCMTGSTQDGKYEVITKEEWNNRGYVASIDGGIYYDSLEKAINAVENGNTVRLLKDISGSFTLTRAKTYTLNLDKYTINGNVTVKAGNVTITNGTINYTGTGNALKTEGNSAVLTANCTVNASKGTALSAGYGSNSGTVNAIGGMYTGKLGTAGGGTLSISAGKYSSDPTQYLPEGFSAKLGSDNYYTIRAALNADGFMEIYNLSDLQNFASQISDGNNTVNAILMADIDLNSISDWTPIGKSQTYSGTFDGNGNSIFNLKITATENNKSLGLFASVGESGFIKNLRIASGEISGIGNRTYAGGIAGGNNGTIQNCSNAADINISANSSIGNNMHYIGGIAGTGNGVIDRCYNEGAISSPSNYGTFVCGITASSNATVSNCYNTGKITGNYHVQGIGGGDVYQCFNWGELTCIGTDPNTGNAKEYSIYPVSRNGGEKQFYRNKTEASGNTPGKAQSRDDAQFKSGSVAWELNNNSANGAWYQTLGVDPYPVLDPTHARVYMTSDGLKNYTYNGYSTNPVTVKGGNTVAGITSQLPKTVTVNSDKPDGGLTAEVTWDTSPLSNYDPDNWEKQTFTLNGTAYVTGLKNGGEKQVQITVTVNAVIVDGLWVDEEPTKQEYIDGDTLDLSGIKIMVNYNDVNRTEVELSYDSPGLTFSIGSVNNLVTHGMVLDKNKHEGTLRVRYSNWIADSVYVKFLSTDNTIREITYLGNTAVLGDDGEYTLTLPKGTTLPGPDGSEIPGKDFILVRANDPYKVKSKTLELVEGRNNYWEITVVAESGHAATYYLEVLIDGWNKDAIDSLKQAWDDMDNKEWNPTQAEVQQGPSKDGDDNNPSYEMQLKAWLLKTMVERGMEIPANVTADISFTKGPDWATAGDRHNNRNGVNGKFEFSITFTATQGSEDTHETVTFDSQSGTITATAYEAPDYTVHFNSGGGSPVADLIVKEDDVIGENAPADPTFEHYTFLGWFTEQTGGEKWDMANDKVDRDNITLYAQWELTKYKVVLPENQHGYTLTADKEKVVWNESVTFTYKLGVGYNGDALVIKVNGTQVTPDGNGQFTVGGNVDSDIVVTVEGVINAPTYTVTIPESVNLDSTATVSAAGVNVAEGSSLYVAIGGKFSIANSNPLFKQTIDYPVHKDSKNGTQVQPDDTVLTVAGGIANNTGSQVLYFGLPTEEPKYADDYKGTVTFRIGIKDTE